MPLSTIESLLKETSGRFDLFDDTGSLTPVGLFYVNAAQRMLDRMTYTDKMRAKHTAAITVDDFTITFPYARAIESVWITDSTGEVQLDMDTYNLESLRKQYAGALADLAKGKPTYGSMNVIRLAPNAAIPAGAYKVGDIVADDSAVGGLLFYPPSDNDYTLIIEGLFYSNPVALAGDKSFWSEVHPDLLLEAIGYTLEVFLRNREGMRDWYEDLKMKTMELTSDLAWQSMPGRMTMNVSRR